MLGKLIKYEWKSIGKVGGVMALALVAVTIIGCIMLQLPAMTNMFTNGGDMSDTSMVIWFMIGFMSFMIYMFMLMGVIYGLYIYLGIRFYRTMYTDQGYLTNTLPVTGHQRLISKILVSGIWYFIIEVLVCISMFALMFSLFGGLFSHELQMSSMTMWEFWTMAFEEILPVYEEMGMDLVRMGIVLLLMLLVLPFTAMATMFGSITLGQLSKKHKGLMGILAYVGVSFLSMIIVSVLQIISTVKYSVELMENAYGDAMLNMNGLYEGTFIVELVIGVVLYIVAHYILTKKLNMD